MSPRTFGKIGTVRGLVRGLAMATTTTPGEGNLAGGNFAVPQIWYSKLQVELTATLGTEQKEEGKKRVMSLTRAGLSSYLCRLCTMRVLVCPC